MAERLGLGIIPARGGVLLKSGQSLARLKTPASTRSSPPRSTATLLPQRS